MYERARSIDERDAAVYTERPAPRTHTRGRGPSAPASMAENLVAGAVEEQRRFRHAVETYGVEADAEAPLGAHHRRHPRLRTDGRGQVQVQEQPAEVEARRQALAAGHGGVDDVVAPCLDREAGLLAAGRRGDVGLQEAQLLRVLVLVEGHHQVLVQGIPGEVVLRRAGAADDVRRARVAPHDEVGAAVEEAARDVAGGELRGEDRKSTRLN